MTRVTFSMYRIGVREPNTTLRSYAVDRGDRPIVTPTSIARSAITRHHRESPQAARDRLVQSFRGSNYWGAKGRPPARGWAAAIVRCYDTYAHLTSEDRRPAFATALERDLELPPDDALGVHVDVVLLNDAGYVPRLVLWDDNELTAARAVLFAAPAWRVMEDDLGEGRVPAVEVWSLRQPTCRTVTSADAAAAMPQVARVVHRLVS